MIAVTILVAIFIAITTCCGNEISSAIVGSTLLSLPIDYYYGGHFQYVLINTIRYAIVNDFKYAVVTPPFQWIGKCYNISLYFYNVFFLTFELYNTNVGVLLSYIYII